ncbi:MAG: Uma2 family endonuclease [Alphaproteobacteria bacterium]|nr:Uma2 family endonuclease [Alphaproteobacteria bacterium]
MERVIGSMGSEYIRFRLDPESVPLLTAKFDWNTLARRVFIDPVTGFVDLMTPSPEHEFHARGADMVMKALAGRLGLRSILLGSTRWRLPGDPENSGAEPDACYYLGETAERWAQAYRHGLVEREAFETNNPPDLVIEVERSPGDRDKPAFYRRLGVPEMWRIDISGNTREALMLDLQAPHSPAELELSKVLPGAGPDFVLEALGLAIQDRLDELDTLIAERVGTETRQ